MPRPIGTFRVRANLPESLAGLVELAWNLHWTWNHEAIALFRRLDRDLWEGTGHNPVRMLGKVSQARLERLARDNGFLDHLHRALDHLHRHLERSTWFEERWGKVETPRIAYFSMEFGLTECLPIYSGGLGILAGDHLKSASELGVPLCGVGLLYRQGYFQQYLSAEGWQQERYPDNDFWNMPVTPERDDRGEPLAVRVPFPGREVVARVWRVQVGRVPLYLLDTNVEENSEEDRRITYQLYGGDQRTRIQQELVLGVGGMMALRALGLHVQVCHMNEGHAAFMAVERIRRRKEKDGLSTEEALEVVRGGTFFTTHTPVPAGIDEFPPALVHEFLGPLLDRSGIDRNWFMTLGRRRPDDPSEPFNMALLALRTTAKANGVSRLHGEVSRRMWADIWAAVPREEVPIGHVTNGIHTRSWTSADMTTLLQRYLGPDWLERPADHSVWERIDQVPDVELWRVHERRRERLIAFARRRLAAQLRARGASKREIEAAREVLNPEALTIGFARRFATYKRATLLLRDPDRLRRLLTDPRRPVQFIFAGKAHPRDDGGKALIREIIHFARREDIRPHFVFLENYDIEIARYLVQGVDVWLNNPRRPLEASGTSGMKVIPNGGLNLSVLDGWWCEGYAPDTGWAIGHGEEYDDPDYQDEVESRALYDVLENEVIPLFYERKGDGPPRGWIAMMKASMRKLGPVFNTNRMVEEYVTRYYIPSAESWRKLSGDGFALARELVAWKQRVRAAWHEVGILDAGFSRGEARVGERLEVEARVRLGSLSPDDVRVELWYGPLDADGEIEDGRAVELLSRGPAGPGNWVYEGRLPCEETGRFGYTARVRPWHPELVDRFDLASVRWLDPAAVRDPAPA